MTARRPYTKHGLAALKRRVKVAGLRGIDQRSAGARELLTFRRALVADLGGEASLTAAKRALVDTATRTALFLAHLDAWLLQQPSLVNGRRRTVLPVVRERQALADSLGRTLQALGLERQAPPPPSLADYLAGHGAPGPSTERGVCEGATPHSLPGPAAP